VRIKAEKPVVNCKFSDNTDNGKAASSSPLSKPMVSVQTKYFLSICLTLSVKISISGTDPSSRVQE